MNLTEIKRERKHLQQDAQLLANRIKLLQLEDEKTWKKIQETKRKAKMFSKIKHEQQFHFIKQQEAKMERERAISEKRDTYKRMREIEKEERSRLRSAIFHSKQEEAYQVKNQRESNIRNIQDNMESLYRENKKKKQQVQTEKFRGRAKILDFIQKKSEVGREVYWKKIEENEKIKNEMVREVEGMEKLEMELLKRLQNTQVLKEHASKELETMMRSPGMNSIYSAMLSKKILMEMP